MDPPTYTTDVIYVPQTGLDMNGHSMKVFVKSIGVLKIDAHLNC